jgi:hypothetical protein
MDWQPANTVIANNMEIRPVLPMADTPASLICRASGTVLVSTYDDAKQLMKRLEI